MVFCQSKLEPLLDIAMSGIGICEEVELRKEVGRRVDIRIDVLLSRSRRNKRQK
jgi:hypothetical protein